ncbi:MAG: L-seryl-tRNA(Sec) selenium transferase [Planctomycetota bacterium]|nr:L-seryl-tRNA(Sec) selenium transferase [Planctomycetota bacterium]
MPTADDSDLTAPLPPPTPPAGAGNPQALLRTLPPVNDVLDSLDDAALELAPRAEWLSEVRQALSDVRAKILSGAIGPVVLEKSRTPAALIAGARRRIERKRDPGCVRVVNATGVVLHTNLGRAAMPPAAHAALAAEGHGYQLLAADAALGERSPRERHVEALFQQLTGCEAATVVNNNAAATMIALAALAEGREVIVARGQLVEIGGAYRIPDVMRQSGATLREVGTTNRVHLRDYENAINEKTALIMRVHTSNYRVEGFHGEVSIEDMVKLARSYDVKVVDDLGSGALVSLDRQGLPDEEPLISSSIDAGVDLITASGDKLIGGPQMGILVGSRECVARVRAHQLYRAVRCGKLSLIAMEATLRLFLHPDKLDETHPTYRMLTGRQDEMLTRAEALRERLASTAPVRDGAITVAAEKAGDAVGAGSLPTAVLPGAAVTLAAKDIEAGELARRLRAHRPPVFTTVHDHLVHVHVRTLQPGDDDVVVAAVESAGKDHA